MRIALVSSHIAEPPGGSELYAESLASALAERHEVLLFTGGRTTVRGIDTVHLPALPRLPAEASRTHKAIWHLRDQWLPRVHRALERGLRQFAPQVVHTHHPQGLSGAAFTAVAATSTPHVHTAHDANAFCARISMTRGGEYCGGHCAPCLVQRQIRPRLLSRSVDRLIAPSDHFRDLHVRAGVVAPERAQTIRQGAAPGTTRLRTRDGERFTIGFIGALAAHKGLPTLLAAFGSAPPEWRLRIAGSGPLQERVSRQSRVEARIDYAGRVSGADKDAFLDSLDVIVIPSEYEENAPLVAIEAAVRGLPAVVSDRGGLPETPEAHVFPARDVRALLTTLHALSDSADTLRKTSERLLAARERFLWVTHVRRVEQVLITAAGEAPLAGSAHR